MPPCPVHTHLCHRHESGVGCCVAEACKPLRALPNLNFTRSTAEPCVHTLRARVPRARRSASTNKQSPTKRRKTCCVVRSAAAMVWLWGGGE
eukprot:366122-Chlamydomonas_euryale.AAC.23